VGGNELTSDLGSTNALTPGCRHIRRQLRATYPPRSSVKNLETLANTETLRLCVWL